jgi:hypothetical protein
MSYLKWERHYVCIHTLGKKKKKKKKKISLKK